MTIRQMQDLSRDTMEYASKIIVSGMTLIELRGLCEEYMLSHGADSFWYWDVGAFIFSGDGTAASVSGREYKTDDRQIKHNDIITIDLSPQRDSVWGDYARTLIVENGYVVTDIDCIQNIEWKRGLEAEEHLHEAMHSFVNTDTTFEELFHYINNEIKILGYVNLDFLGNLGHSIVKNKNDRIYIEKGNREKLSSVEAFTFEPHISTQKSAFGFKKEDIYTFCDNTLVKL
ncbi:MAG: aminopeptidase P family protein [Clostridia bacterium]|nr:aminopeptidase P family protein [Clostridia bacterium]